MRLVLLGPPGSGKGTQARMLSKKLGIPQVSTGDILREAVAAGSELGREARSYMDSGRLVPDDVMVSLVDRRISEPDCRGGFVLDGFPRTLAQAMGLEETLQGHGSSIELVLLMDVDDDEILSRLSKRRVCPKCNALYNLDADPPKRDEICDRCGVGLVLRADDAEATVRTRLSVYRNDTLPLVEYYESRGILRRIDGRGRIEEIFARVMGEISGVRPD
jgi:adenylate kinase